MLVIAGNGMGENNFSNIDLDFSKFDKIVCDKSFKEESDNILKLGFKEAKEYILKNYKRQNLLYVVTGSPLFFSAGVIIAKYLPKDRVRLINNISSKRYLLEKLCIDEIQVSVVSIHGRVKIDLKEFLDKKYTFVLCDKNSIKRLQFALKFFKKESFTLTIGYKLGYKDEIIKEIELFDFDGDRFDLTSPFVLLIKRNFEFKKSIFEDIEFKTQRGMITKRYKRDLTLQNLDIEPNNIFWDIGAGSGSCGIVAYRRYRAKVTFFEKNEKRIEFIKQNLTNHFVADCTLYEGKAEELFEKAKENPDRIFVGGGGEKVIAKLPYLYKRLKDNGIMLINAITLKHLSQMITILNQADIKYEIYSISLSTYKGELNLATPERQLFQIKVMV